MSESSFFAHINKKKEPEQSKAVESSSDRFFAHIDQISAESQQATTNYNATRELDPDTEAQNYNMSQEAGLPLSVVRNAPEQVKEVLGSPVYTIDDPTLIQKYLGRSYNNTAISGDDIPGLEKVQKTFASNKESFIDTAFAPSSEFAELPQAGPGTISRLLSERPSVSELIKAGTAGVALGVAAIPRALGQLVDFVAPFIVDKRKLEFRDKNLEKVTLSNDLQDWLRGQYGDTKAAELLASSFESLGMMGTLLVSGGGSAVLPGMSAIAGMEKTTEALEGGASTGKAVTAGAIQAATEYLTEKIPIDKLRAPASSFIKKLLQGALFDVPGELIATATEMWLIDEKILGREHKTEDEYKQALIDTALVAVITTTVATATTHVAQEPPAKPPTPGVMDAEVVRKVRALEKNKKFSDALDGDKEALDETLTAERSRDHAKQVAELIGERTEDVYISSEGFDEFFQTHTNEEAVDILKKISVDPVKARESITTGEDTSVKASDILTLTQEEYAALKEDIKPAPGAYTQREIKDQKANEDIENSINLLKEETERNDKVNTEIDRITEEIKKTKLPDTKLAEDAPILLKGLANRLALEGIDPVEFLQKVSVKKGVFEDIKGFFQARKGVPPRGAVIISDEQILISLYEGANMSTLLHEIGHTGLFKYSQLERSGQASAGLKKDMSTIRTWVGAAEGADLTEEQSEQFARGFEAYLMEGKAPTTELRAAFERFKQWLIQTYKTAKSLNVKLDKNIRGVFDRMLSANLEVEATAASGGFTIKTTDEMNTLGVSKEDQLFATRLIEETTRKAERQLTQARNKNYSENLKKWKTEAQKEIRAENPIYETIDTIIKEGNQIDRDQFIDRYTEEGVKFLPNRKLIVKDGLNIDSVAALFEFVDTFDMIDTFFTTPKFNEAVAQRVNEKQLAHDAQWSAEDFIVDQKEYRDYLNLMARYINGQVVDEAAVDKAVNTNLPRWQKEAQKEITNESPDLTGDALDEAIATRVEEKVTAFRERKAKPSAITTDTLKRLARETMAAKSVREARRVDKFLAAAKKASSDGRRAILRKDWGAASTASELERFNYEMATLSVKIRDEVATVQKRAKRIGQSKTIDFEHKEAILHLVGRYNLASLVPQEPQTIPDYASLFADDSFGNKGYPIPDFLLSNVVNDFRDLRIEQLRDLDNAIRYLEDQGRIGKKEIMADGVTLFADVNEDSVSILDTMKVLKKWEKGSMMRRLTDFTRGFFARLDSLTFVMKSGDGYTNLGKDGVKGPLELYVIDPIKRGLNTLFAQKGEINKELKPHLKQIEKTNRKWRKAFGSHINIEGVPVPEVMRADGQTKGWRDYQIWAVILNTGNIGEKSNMENLLAGYSDLTPAMVEKMKSMLTVEDMRAVQGVWDTMDSMFSQADAQFLKDNNYHMPKVIATPFRFKGQDFKGGYYPIKHDRSLSYRVADRGLVEDFFNNEGTKITVPYTKKNFSVKRQGGVALPIRLELSLIDSHFRDVLNYIHLTDPIRDADRITRDDSFRESATNVLGEAVYNTIRPSLQHIANPIMEGIDLPAARGVELMRGLSTLYSLAWNTGVALKQPLSTFGAIRDMGFVPYVKGFSSVMVSPSMHYQRMKDLSVYMEDRLTSFDRELKSQFLKLTAEQKGIYFGDTKVTWQDVKNFGFWQIRVADTVTVLPIWNGAFQDKLLPDQSNLEESIAYADDIVRNSQPSAQPLDLSSWQRDGGVLRLFSQFQTFTVGKYGQRQRLFYRAMKNGSISKGEYAWFNFMDAIVPLVGINLLQSILWGRDIDDEELSDIMANVLTGWATMGVPIVGSIARTVTTGYGDAFDSPVLETANKLIRGLITGAKSLDGFKNDKEREKALWALAHVISIYSGVPLDKIVARAQRGAKQKEGVPGIKYLVPAPKKK